VQQRSVRLETAGFASRAADGTDAKPKELLPSTIRRRELPGIIYDSMLDPS
jgi:hypothetical protein